MFSKVLLPSDLREASDRVIQRLKGLKSLGTTKVVLLRALGIRHLDHRLDEFNRIDRNGFQTV